MSNVTESEIDDIRAAVRELCASFPGEYWRGLEPDRYPREFVDALTEHGWLAALIPTEYGGPGLPLRAAAAIMEEISASGANAGACHAQMYTMGVVLRHGSDEQKQRYLPNIASGDLRLQAFGVSEPDAGSDTPNIRTRAVRTENGWRINGQKIWTSRAEHSDLMVLLARTTPIDDVDKRWKGLSVFLVDLREAGDAIQITPIKTMMNHATTELYIDDLLVPEDALVGTEGLGFRHILDGMNAERILIAAECVGDGRFLLDRASEYARERVVFGRPIGANQGVAFPLARAYASLYAADLARKHATEMFDRGEPCGTHANLAKLLAAEASWEAANAAIDAYGGYGFADEYDVERKFRETRLYKTAPISNNLVVAHIAHHELGLPRSY